MASIVKPPKAPNLPLAPPEYLRTYFDQFASMLRLYFNQLDGYNNAIGYAVGRFVSTVTQNISGPSNPTKVTFNTVDISSNVSLDTTTSRFSVSQAGKYLFQWDLPAYTASGSPVRKVWLKRDGVDIANTVHTASGCCIIELSEVDYVELYWYSTNVSDTLPYVAGTGSYPAQPSASMVITFVST